jgi:hypothetical protein
MLSSMRKTLLVVIIFLVIACLVGSWRLYLEVGRTPVELLNRAEMAIQDNPPMRRVLEPIIEGLREWFSGPTYSGSKAPFFIPLLPPGVATPTTDETAEESHRPSITRTAKSALGRTLRVGPGRALPTIGMAARMAKDGDVIEIDAGDYYADTAIFDRAALVVRGVGGRARLYASGAIAEGKAIWVIRGGNVTVENIEFIGATAPDGNGAGIRLESGHLVVRHCLFYGNQTGLLTAGGDSDLEIEFSEFAYNGAGDGQTHNLYVGAIRSLKVTGSYFHHANVGHLLKSRAAINFITYNRLTDESGGRASYELEFPNGGIAYVIGNIIQQGAQAENSTLVSYGAEGYTKPVNELHLVHNTIVNDEPYGGAFLRVASGAQLVRTRNNILVGPGRLHVAGPLDSDGDVHAGWEIFENAARQDYRLASSGQMPRAILSGFANGIDLTPAYEYQHPLKISSLSALPAFPGALQSDKVRP